MHRVEHPSSEILRTHRPLVQRIVDITSERRRLSEVEQRALSRYVATQMNGPDTHRLGTFRGYSSLQSYIAVVVQRLYHALRGSRPKDSPEPSALEHAIRRTASSLSAREALVLKMWFESGMTTLKIATVLGLEPSEVHAVIAERTGGVQKSLEQSHPAKSHPTGSAIES